MPNKKIIVGVHGIGDQVKYETIQAIAYQFCRHYDIPAAVPVGGVHSSVKRIKAQQLFSNVI